MSSLGWVKKCNWGVFDLVRRREYTIKFLTSRVNAWWIVVYHGISILPSPWLAGAPLGKPRAAPIFGSWIPAEQHTDALRSPKSSTESFTESSSMFHYSHFCHPQSLEPNKCSPHLHLGLCKANQMWLSGLWNVLIILFHFTPAGQSAKYNTLKILKVEGFAIHDVTCKSRRNPYLTAKESCNLHLRYFATQVVRFGSLCSEVAGKSWPTWFSADRDDLCTSLDSQDAELPGPLLPVLSDLAPGYTDYTKLITQLSTTLKGHQSVIAMEWIRLTAKTLLPSLPSIEWTSLLAAEVEQVVQALSHAIWDSLATVATVAM